MRDVFESGVAYSVIELEAVIVLVSSCEGGSRRNIPRQVGFIVCKDFAGFGHDPDLYKTELGGRRVWARAGVRTSVLLSILAGAGIIVTGFRL